MQSQKLSQLTQQQQFSVVDSGYEKLGLRSILSKAKKKRADQSQILQEILFKQTNEQNSQKQQINNEMIIKALTLDENQIKWEKSKR